ncbi:hypothetical protein HHK36_011418 [Tetracentron sinense]|uniref:Small nuclear ribonucleoprotein G n=1 Tax=Tetracentron sinense TaxID=13715 RepID=A0A834ZBT2_TETSI|nr:hypothetical protein HHK36_011418 [Tetracentron sinense]
MVRGGPLGSRTHGFEALGEENSLGMLWAPGDAICGSGMCPKLLLHKILECRCWRSLVALLLELGKLLGLRGAAENSGLELQFCVAVKLNANRMVVGTLRGFDQFMNLVIDNTLEVNGNEKNDIGMVVIRGNSVVTVEALEPVSRMQ